MKELRYASIPLVAVDPFFSIWSGSDNLYDDDTRHWTGKKNALTGFIKIDNIPYRFMGTGNMSPEQKYWHLPKTLNQVSVQVKPLSTIYNFECDEIKLSVKFTTPLLLNDLKLMSRPVTYISYEISSNDGKTHNVEVMIMANSEICSDSSIKTVKLETYNGGARCGRIEQDILKNSGDDIRIEWGYLHLFSKNHTPFIGNKSFVSAYFLGNNIKELESGTETPIYPTYPFIALKKEYQVDNTISDFICIGYDDIHSIEYFGKPIDAYWKKDGESFDDICRLALDDYEDILKKADKFDDELIKKADAISEKYKDIVCLAYRQAVSAHKLTWDGSELQFISKENFSNGCAATVDVTYPSIPLFLIYNPELVCGMLNPIFKYADTDMWTWDFAPHDVGQYPKVNGQVYGMEFPDERNQMPVEECGNLILCVAAICNANKNADYAKKHYEVLKKWAGYLKNNGLDPENQLCTDDFAGHLAHNVNLSAKAIMALGAWGMINKMLGNNDVATEYAEAAKKFAKQWKEKAKENDHYKLSFDANNTWSIKYNIVWDKILGLDIFDKDIFEDEVKYYMTKANRYGLPLDSRSDYTKSDWQMWSTMLTDNKEYKNMIFDAMWDMLNETEDRVPFTDWYFTSTPNWKGFIARSVQGGLFINLLK